MFISFEWGSIMMGAKTDHSHPFVLQKYSCHLQLKSLCVAHRIKRLTMLLCVMLCHLWCNKTKEPELFLFTVDIYWMNELFKINAVAYTCCISLERTVSG